MNKKQYKLIIFDCDGTLVDSEHLISYACAVTLNDMGYTEYNADKCLELFHATCLNDVVDKLKILHDDFDEEAFKKHSHHGITEAYRQGVIAFQDTFSALDFIKTKGIQMCVASNGSKSVVISSLERTGLMKYFIPHEIFSYEQVGIGKPNPELFLYTADTMGYKPEECLVVEDSVIGVMAANRANMDVIAINRDCEYSQFSHLKTLKNVDHMCDILRFLG